MLKNQFILLKAIRKFFENNSFLEVMTPPMVQNPGMETHIHPFEVIRAKDKSATNLYLHTSPEFYMKGLLGQQDEIYDRIFNISYCFRDEPESPQHRSQFIMCEWYRKNENYLKIMQDCEKLFSFCLDYLKDKKIETNFSQTSFQKVTVDELFQDILNISILDFLDTNELKKLIEKDFKDVPLPSSDCSWDDYFFLLFLNKVEPTFKNIPFLLLYEFPAPLAALSTLKEENPKVCERFEIYSHGIELCNCFNELTNLEILQKRFQTQNKDKLELYHYELPSPTQFYGYQKKLPKSAGIALGVERLLMALVKNQKPFFTLDH